VLDGPDFAALFANGDHLAFPYRVRGDVHLIAVHQDVAVADKLPCLGAGSTDPNPIDGIIQATFQQRKQGFSRYPFRGERLLEIVPELGFQDPVEATQLLFFPQLQAVTRDPGAASLAVLSGYEVAPVNSTLACEAPLTFQEKLNAFSTA
jgi:hypothetical protein